MLKRRWVATALVAVGLVLPVASATPVGADAGSDEGAFVAKINGLRASQGLGSLAVHGELVGVARNWTAQMAAAGNISHNPNFSGQVSAPWTKLGENVGMGGDVDSLFQAFVDSPGHYKNLVDPSFTHVGVAVQYSNGTIFTTHQFMTLPGGGESPAPAPPPSRRSSRAPAAAPASQPAPEPQSAPEPAPAAPAPAAPAAPPPPPPPPPPAPERILHSLDELRVLAALGS